MRKLGLNELRREFLDFFDSKEHYVADSYSLIPIDDPSVLLVNAGMQPLKKYFTGAAEPPKRRMATCQKCFRTNDIDNVGFTARHATMFEMLGNFSFGDYFKKETLQWGWEFFTKVLEIDADLLWPSVYEDDEEAFRIWNEVIGVPAEKITKLGKADNFWEIGTGPCGPCSEIYFDRGEKYGCGCANCRPGCDCDRFTEIWNHVFSEFDRQEDGTYLPLKQKNIDTGMGLERLALVVQGVDSIFEIDTIKHIYDAVLAASKEKIYSSAKIVTDHIKSTIFLIGDGVNPSNEGRGYVLRRVFRRAVRHALKLGISREGFISFIDVVTKEYGDAYTTLKERKEFITKVIEAEYDRFAQTLDSGMSIFEKWTADGKITGEQVFTLYDTYGFPVELTKELLDEKNMTFDEAEFHKRMEHQKNIAREAAKTTGWETDEISEQSEFKGYEEWATETEIVYIDEKEFVLRETPFYAESGGQISDTGRLRLGEVELLVTGVRKNQAGTILHAYEFSAGRGVPGDVKSLVGKKAHAEIDMDRRRNIMRNHSATHLLHAALRSILGTHVTQAGSLVSYDKLRFDFTHFEALGSDTLKAIEDEVNRMIFAPAAVETSIMSKDEAIKAGAMALFGEKYGAEVRVIRMGDYSVELCGGTHLSSTAEVGVFKIVSEGGIAAGIRRIEAITGPAVYALLKDQVAVLFQLEHSLKAKKETLVDKVEALIASGKALTKENEALKQKLLSAGDDAEEVGKFRLHYKREKGMDVKTLRTLGDQICAKDAKTVFIAISDGKAVVMVAKEAVASGASAGDIVKKLTEILGGGGGGKTSMAQASIADESKIDAALKEIKIYLGGM